MMKRFVVALCAWGLAAHGADCWPTSEISYPCYRGGFEVGGSWVYLQPTATDGDLEYGSFITLTMDPANLNALLLEVEPSYQSGFEVGLGYFCPNSNRSVQAGYFFLRGSEGDSKRIISLNQFIQNFLGASYSTSAARSRHEIDQGALAYRVDGVIDRVLDVHFVLGATGASIRREFDVKYGDLVLNPNPSQLVGREKSEYWGVGPFVGMEFGFPLWCHLGLVGSVDVGVLFGETRSRVTSKSFRDNATTSFAARDVSHPAVTNLNCDLGLVYSRPLPYNLCFAIEAGYQVRYYFHPINRIDPFNGYVINPNPFPVGRTSNLGLGGPYVYVSVSQSLFPYARCPFTRCPLPNQWVSSGPSFEFTSYWLEPRPTNSDLVFAILNEPGGGEQDIQADPDLSWASKYQLGYRICPTIDLSVAAFLFESSNRKKIAAGPGESISSVNASGPATVVFSSATSRVQYKIDQFDGLLGKSVHPCRCLQLHGGLGLRYLRQDRTLTNQYFGGTPPATTESKFPVLKSRYRGIGPLFTFEPVLGPLCNFELVGRIGLAFLVGEAKATLDQDNFGDTGFSSNNLRTPHSPLIAPVFEGSAAVGWNYDCLSCVHIGLEAGYEYLAYFRTVRLVLPTLLTGLEQINSDLTLQGPYIRGQVGLSF